MAVSQGGPWADGAGGAGPQGGGGVPRGGPAAEPLHHRQNPQGIQGADLLLLPTMLYQVHAGSHRSVYLQWELVLPLCVSDPGKPSAPCARSRMVLRICTLKGAEAGFCSGPASLSISCDGMPRHVNSFALQIIPSLRNWEEVLFLTDVPSWTPHAVFQATRLFVSSLNAKLVRPTTASAARRHSCEM